MGSLDDPYGVACDPTTGDVYVANSNGGDIVVFNASGTELGTMGTVTKGKLGFTQGIWVDSDGSVWADSGTNDTVYHFASWAVRRTPASSSARSTWTPRSAWRRAPPAPTGSPGTPGTSTSRFPASTRWGSSSVRVPRPRRGTCAAQLCLVGTFGSRGTGVGKLATPQGLAFGPDGDLYVVEENNDRVSQWTVP